MSTRAVGIFQILLSGLAFGTLGVLGKMAFKGGMSPGELLSFRFLISGLLLGLFVLAFKSHQIQKLGLRTVGACLALGILGYALFSSFYFAALERISASMTVLLLYLYPSLVALGAWIFFKEKLHRNARWALGSATLGMLLLVGGDLAVRDWSGVLLGFFSALFYSIYILASSRWLSQKPILICTALIQLSAGLCLSSIYLKFDSPTLDLFLRNWPLILSVALIASVFAMTLFLMGLQKLSSSEVSILSTTEPVSAIFLAMIFLGEHLSPVQIFGSLLVIGALLLCSKKS